jgi:PleD family two-component response regulator
MDEPRHKVLLSDDDASNRLVLSSILTKAGYDVAAVDCGERALEVARAGAPDLFLLDVEMPGLDGLEVCRLLKRDEALARIPVVFITSRDQTDDILAGFEAGAADYVTKPVKRAELLARVRTHVRLYQSILELERLNRLALDANPLTGLPGNNSLSGEVSRALADGERACVIYCDLDNFKAFNDKYGFARGDEAIRFAARVIGDAVRSSCGRDGFVGHIGGDDFAVLVPDEKAKGVGEEIARLFDEGAPRLYDPEDRLTRGIMSVSRAGEAQRFPIMSISMGGVSLARGGFAHYLEVAGACAEVKKLAKREAGSCLCFDRRGGC